LGLAEEADRDKGSRGKGDDIAGGIVRRSWNEEPISQDREMHAPDTATELQALQPVERAFLDAVKNRDVGGRPADSRSDGGGAG
jgi:hypothetical protein